MFNHARYPQSQSLSKLTTVSVTFAQIPLGLRGVRSQKLCGEETSGLGMGAVAQPLFCNPGWQKSTAVSLLSPFLCSPHFSAFSPEAWALSLAAWSSQLSQAGLISEQAALSPLPISPTRSSGCKRQLLYFSQSTA